MATVTKQNKNFYRIDLSDTEGDLIDRALLDVPQALNLALNQLLADFALKFRRQDEVNLNVLYERLSPADQQFIRQEIESRVPRA